MPDITIYDVDSARTPQERSASRLIRRNEPPEEITVCNPHVSTKRNDGQ